MIQGVYPAAAEFFQLDIETKRKDALPFDAGYRPFGIEYSDSPNRPDLMESFSTSYFSHDAQKTLQTRQGKHLYKSMHALHNKLEILTENFVIKLADTIGGPHTGEKFRNALHQWSILQINHNINIEDTRSQYINDPHEDACLVTLISNTGPGLEFRMPDGTFSPINISDDELLLVPGEILWLLTGGVIQPLYHRVVRTESSLRRKALLFFADPDPELCTPWIASDVNRGIDIGDRIRRNPLLIGLRERGA